MSYSNRVNFWLFVQCGGIIPWAFATPILGVDPLYGVIFQIVLFAIGVLGLRITNKRATAKLEEQIQAHLARVIDARERGDIDSGFARQMSDQLTKALKRLRDSDE